MRKIRIFEHISLDGVIRSSADENDFPYTGPGPIAPRWQRSSSCDVWQGLRSAAWPTHLRRLPVFWPKAPSSPMSDALNTAKKYVVTQRPESLEWGPFEGLASDLVEDVSRIKSQDGGDPILFGSSMLTSPLLEPGVSDEVVLLVDPVLLGTGKRIFAEFLCDHQFVWNLARKSLCRRTVEWYERKLKTIGSP